MVMTVPTGECGRRHQHHRFVRHRDDSVEDRGLARDSHRIACARRSVWRQTMYAGSGYHKGTSQSCYDRLRLDGSAETGIQLQVTSLPCFRSESQLGAPSLPVAFGH